MLCLSARPSVCVCLCVELYYVVRDCVSAMMMMLFVMCTTIRWRRPGPSPSYYIKEKRCKHNNTLLTAVTRQLGNALSCARNDFFRIFSLALCHMPIRWLLFFHLSHPWAFDFGQLWSDLIWPFWLPLPINSVILPKINKFVFRFFLIYRFRPVNFHLPGREINRNYIIRKHDEMRFDNWILI